MKLQAMRRTLMMGSAMAATGFVGYGRGAYAACLATTSPSYVCSGSETTTQTINANGATVSTVPGFSIDTRLPGGWGGDAITITGGGNLSFTDAYGSTISGEAAGPCDHGRQRFGPRHCGRCYGQGQRQDK